MTGGGQNERQELTDWKRKEPGNCGLKRKIKKIGRWSESVRIGQSPAFGRPHQ
jgi:hypothetical protein